MNTCRFNYNKASHSNETIGRIFLFVILFVFEINVVKSLSSSNSATRRVNNDFVGVLGWRGRTRTTIMRNYGWYCYHDQLRKKFTLLSLSQQHQEEEEENSRTTRRKKKNKYAKFSKVVAEYKDDEKEEFTMDPFERLIEESKEKLKVFEEEQKEKEKKRRKQPTKEIVSKIIEANIDKMNQKLSFPDNKDIDPYDPTTFGYVEIGTIIGAHGVHGWVKIQSKTDFPTERLIQPGFRHIKPYKKRAPRKILLIQGRPFGPEKDDLYLLQFDGIHTPERANQLRGSTLYSRQEERVLKDTNATKELAKDDDGNSNDIGKTETEDEDDLEQEYLVSDLVGLDVYLLEEQSDDTKDKINNNKFVGTVGGIVLAQDMCAIPGLGHDMLEIILPRGKKDGMPSFRDELVLIPFVPQIVPKISISESTIYITPPNGLLDLKYVREEKVRIKGFLPPATAVE